MERFCGHQERLREAAYDYTGRAWRVAPAHYTSTPGRHHSGRRSPAPPCCTCRDTACPSPGAHPLSPDWRREATRDPSTVDLWWAGGRARPWNIVVATGHVFDAWETAAPVASRVLEILDGTGQPIGPVLVDPVRGRWTFLTEPTCYESTVDDVDLLADVADEGRVRYHGYDGYVLVPPSRIGTQRLRWWRPPPARTPRQRLPRWRPVADAIRTAVTSTPDVLPRRSARAVSLSCLRGPARRHAPERR